MHCSTRDGIAIWQDIGTSPVPDHNTPCEVLIVGGGPTGLSLALDLGLKGHRVTLLNQLDFIAAGSKAICFAKRTLDIWYRLGVGAAMVERGVIWNVGKIFWGDDPDPVHQFDMLPVTDQQMPGFINLQQYHVETILVQALAALPNVDIRWGHKALALSQMPGQIRLDVTTLDGKAYQIESRWLIACDGHKSDIRHMMALDFEGRVFEDNFLIADVKFKEQRPSERWFWFDPPFNPGQSALLHKQPDDVWRLDFQLGWNIDREACIKPAFVEPLVRGMLGDDVEFAQEWYSVYTFQCRRMARFVHGNVIFAGDAAHLVSPFGARGCNGAIADIDNLGWKLDLVLRNKAPPALIESYDHEAIITADENILNSARATDFMTPKTQASRAFRNAVLELARTEDFARPFINSGRLSTAVPYRDSPLNTPDVSGDDWAGIAPGAPALDAPLDDGWLLERLGNRFVFLSDGGNSPVPDGIERLDMAVLGDRRGLVKARYDLHAGSAYLIRPDQYIAARWREPAASQISAAHARAKGGGA